ncbi:MAG: xanthine dehydrogenase small subunit [Polyangiales bacterium]|jgi:xanthine dehydrogenase small subunit
MSKIELRVNGATIDATGVDPHKSLLHFLRERGLTGTKEGCAEGECGACAVVQVRRSTNGGVRFVPINSCLVLTPAMAGQELITVEGVASSSASEDGLHPVQEAMIKEGGSQCGYCTPGFIMSLFAEYYRDGRNAGDYDPEAIGGNLCRCTGYRPIREALVSLRVPSSDDANAKRLNEAAPALEPLVVEGDVTFDRPGDLSGVFAALKKNPGAKIVAGGTDLVVGINQMEHRHAGFVSLDGVDELRHIDDGEDAIVIGAGVPLSEVESHFHGHSELPIFDELFVLFSSRLIRNRATLGGNLVNASPIGDSPPVLLALDAELELASANGKRRVALSEFFTAYKKTLLQEGELVSAVVIPKPFPTISRFYKVSKRVMDDISTVAAGFGLWLDGDTITKARLAYGGVAATPVRAKDAEAALIGKTLAPHASVLAALAGAFTPMDDHRGSARYRQQMVPSLFEKFCSEQTQAEAAE